MAASAGVAAAAYEGLATAVRGENAGARAVIVIVSREPAAREILYRELSKRYGADYQIVACGRPAELTALMRDLRKAGLLVALVIGGSIARDRRGFILTGPDLPAGTRWPPGRPPLPLETSLPGVFAAGDVRRGSLNRVASAVGEGAATIPLVHRYLHTTAAVSRPGPATPPPASSE